MRLLHTTELRFQEFYEPKIPRYAILSHRWVESEVSYQDFLRIQREDGPQVPSKQRTLLEMWNINRAPVPIRQNAGYDKILKACCHAASDTRSYRSSEFGTYDGPFTWIWIDTCCIDKSSSSELSEAINSMYDWYSNAVVCYAYLSDVFLGDDQSLDYGHRSGLEFRQSQWFTRGWTLQELLAPQNVRFLDKDWKSLGLKESLSHQISDITGIPFHEVESFDRRGVRAAEKFAWAGNRKTTRLEDVAYCLLGLFNVNMPLLYGEGRKAFRRLQAEIIRSSNDESVFLWGISRDLSGSLLAKTPGNFLEYRKTIPAFVLRSDGWSFLGPPRFAYTITNQGLELEVPRGYADGDELLYPLDCHPMEEDHYIRSACALVLRNNRGKWYRSRYQSGERAAAATKYEIDVLCLHNRHDGECKECRNAHDVGLYLVPHEFMWTHDDLKSRGSTKIYCYV